MNAVQNFASHSFAAYALKNISPDEDANGLFCQVPSSDGKWYTVRCVEGKSSVHASHCNCSSFTRHQHCTHVEVVKAYYGRFYKPVAVEAPVKVAPVKKIKRTPLVRKVRNGGLVRVAQPAPVAKIIEQAVEAVVPTPKKDMMSAALTTNKGFSILR
jgi:hypothetical protein